MFYSKQFFLEKFTENLFKLQQQDNSYDRNIFSYYSSLWLYDYLFYLYTLAVSHSLGGSRQHKRNNKNNRGFTPFFQQWRGIQPSLDGTAGATQPILPRLPQLKSLHRCRLPYCPYHRGALTCLPYIHPPIIQRSLYSIHPSKPRPPSSISPVNFCIHYLFQ